MERQVARYLSREVGSYAAAINIVAQYQNILNLFGNARDAYDHIREILSEERAYVQAQIAAGHTRAAMAGQKRKVTNDQNPDQGRLQGPNITTGDICLYSRDYMKCSLGNYGSLGRKDLVRKGTFLFKGMNEYTTAKRKYELSVDVGTENRIYLPMYAINLSAIAWQGYTVGNDLIGQYKTIPMYRLIKNGDLATGTTNYVWERIYGQNADGTSDVIWHRKWTDGVTDATPKYKHNWSNIRMLIECAHNADCILHTDIVKFRNGCGPRREYVDATAAIGVFDPALPDRENSSNDVFWESFWAHRIVHPCAEYTNTDKEKNIVFVKKGSIRMNMNEASFPNYHYRSIFFRDGAVRSLQDSRHSDSTSGSTLNENLKAQPLDGTHAAGVSARTEPYLTNQVMAVRESSIYNEDREKDYWLLVYSDMLPIRHNALNEHCSFDISVTNKYEWMATGKGQIENVLA